MIKIRTNYILDIWNDSLNEFNIIVVKKYS
jgi:hypothetical protein